MAVDFQNQSNDEIFGQLKDKLYRKGGLFGLGGWEIDQNVLNQLQRLGGDYVNRAKQDFGHKNYLESNGPIAGLFGQGLRANDVAQKALEESGGNVIKASRDGLMANTNTFGFDSSARNMLNSMGYNADGSAMTYSQMAAQNPNLDIGGYMTYLTKAVQAGAIDANQMNTMLMDANDATGLTEKAKQVDAERAAQRAAGVDPTGAGNNVATAKAGEDWTNALRLEEQRMWQNRTNALDKVNFDRVANPWEKNNPLYQASVSQQTGDHANALSNQLERQQQSAVLRGIRPGSGINAETDRAARFANARSLGGALNNIEADRYQRYASHEVDQTNRQNAFNEMKAKAQDALSRQDINSYMSLQKNLADFASQQSDLKSQLALQPGQMANDLAAQKYQGDQIAAEHTMFNDPASKALRAAQPGMALNAQVQNSVMAPINGFISNVSQLAGSVAPLFGAFSSLGQQQQQQPTGMSPTNYNTMGSAGATRRPASTSIGSTLTGIKPTMPAPFDSSLQGAPTIGMRR